MQGTNSAVFTFVENYYFGGRGVFHYFCVLKIHFEGVCLKDFS